MFFRDNIHAGQICRRAIYNMNARATLDLKCPLRTLRFLHRAICNGCYLFARLANASSDNTTHPFFSPESPAKRYKSDQCKQTCWRVVPSAAIKFNLQIHFVSQFFIKNTHHAYYSLLSIYTRISRHTPSSFPHIYTRIPRHASFSSRSCSKCASLSYAHSCS